MTKQGSIAVVGLGYVGLPLAVLAAKKGFTVVGYDIDAKKVDLINQGIPPIEDATLARDLTPGLITASTDPSVVATVNTVVVAVPTPVTPKKEPDLTALTNSVKSILPHLTSGQLLSIESTINPGVMETLVLPILATRTDLAVDIVHCPERVNPGDAKWTVRNIPRVIGGLTPQATKRGREFYESILDAPVKEMATMTEAEAVKILENTFRDVNIAFINEMAKSFDKLGIDITHVIAGAATKPFSFLPHFPGNGVGGHCISVDPYYMIERGRQAGFNHEFLKLARHINDSMPAYTVSLLSDVLTPLQKQPKDTTVAMLGLSYKKNIDDTRESPAFEIKHLLEKAGYVVRVFDPHVLDQSTVRSLDEALEGAHVVMVATDHAEFMDGLTAEALTQKGISIVIDGKNALDADSITAAGITYRGIGRRR
ncbi:MAG: nucleotide sugar dehydrogenase [Candidatus Andersenbacteria bacterium]|nr:nucleotide sugar dehydrogenase [Candidatus Andersenbacteria bacterium]MBI3250382.1 nucleotide sugar dehydrogenase [Candidatus Andersenbacteria bacterium]